MNINELKNYIGFGIAGNFAHHLDQAGEAKDFVDVIVDEENAPKGIFPFYAKDSDTFLNIFPLSNDKITIPNDSSYKVQVEPEVALVCEILYEDNKVIDLNINYFTAYNDCSIREPAAAKISMKKNWGKNTKGISNDFIKVDSFEKDGIMDNYAIASFLKDEDGFHEYGKDSNINTYSYFHTKLKNWIINKLNTQKDFGPLEDLHNIIKQNNKPKNMIIAIGATQYTDFGENRYLKKGDEIYICLYNRTKYNYNEIISNIKNDNFNLEGTSILHQVVV